MSITAPFPSKHTAPLALVAFAFLLSFTIAPMHAHASAVTLVSATTTSNNASTTLAKVGDVVSYGLVLSGTPSSTTTPLINIFGFGTTSMSGAGTNWSYSTTTSAGWTNGFVTFNMSWGGTAGEASTTITQTSLTGSNIRFDKTAPVLGSLTSTATTTGALKVGDTITFTVLSASPEAGGTVTGTYNSVPVTFATTDAGTTFVGTYTVVEGQTDQPTPVQFSGITLRDAAGNTASGSTGDVLKTIDANTPGTPASSLASGTYSVVQPGTSLTSAGADTIRFTLGGSAPTCTAGTIYTGPITITGSSPVEIVGCDAAGNASSVVTYNYIIQGASHRSSGGGGGGGGSSVTTVPAPAPAAVAAVSGTPAATHAAITRNLTVGSAGTDVMWLQAFLNDHGFPVAASGTGSKGHETNTFGARTKAALAKFQAAKGITPAAGYFGAKTRTAVLGM